MMRWKAALACSLLFTVSLLVAEARSAPIKITDCDTRVPAGRWAQLVGDLTCEYRCGGNPDAPCEAWFGGEECGGGLGVCEERHIMLEEGALLDLQGYTLFSAYQATAVECTGPAGTSCRIRSGTLEGGKGRAIQGGVANVLVKNLNIQYFDSAIQTQGRLHARNLRLEGGEESLSAAKGVRLRNVRLADGGVASGGNLTLFKVEAPYGSIHAAGYIRGRILKLGYTQIEGRDVALVGVNPNSWYTDGSSEIRIRATRNVFLRDSHVASIKSGSRPRLENTLCSNSAVIDTDESWQVCSSEEAPDPSITLVQTAGGAVFREGYLGLRGTDPQIPWNLSTPEPETGLTSVDEFLSLWEAENVLPPPVPPTAHFTCTVGGEVVNHVVQLLRPTFYGGYFLGELTPSQQLCYVSSACRLQLLLMSDHLDYIVRSIGETLPSEEMVCDSNAELSIVSNDPRVVDAILSP